jgi:hypothetical protein
MTKMVEVGQTPQSPTETFESLAELKEKTLVEEHKWYVPEGGEDPVDMGVLKVPFTR